MTTPDQPDLTAVEQLRNSLYGAISANLDGTRAARWAAVDEVLQVVEQSIAAANELPVTLTMREWTAEQDAELRDRFAEAMTHPARLVVIPTDDADERERAAYERGKAEGIAEGRAAAAAELADAMRRELKSAEAYAALPRWGEVERNSSDAA